MKRIIVFIVAALILFPALASQASESSQIDPAKVRRELKQILSSPEYQPVQPSPIARFIQNIGKTIGRFIRKIFDWIVSGLALDKKSKMLDKLGAWAVASGFVVLLLIVVRRLIIASQNVSYTTRKPEPFADQMPTGSDLIHQAAKLAESGDYRSAFRAAYLASIAYLDDLSLLRFERSRTNWEYLRELSRGGHKEQYQQLRPITVDFDRKIYGGETCEKEDYVNAVHVFNILTEQAK